MLKNYPAVVLGMFETGLGVGRSLGRNGIPVFGLDFKKDTGFYSKYIKAKICPHPLNDEEKFLDFLIEFAKKFEERPVLFITSDSFLNVISYNQRILKKYFFINISNKKIIGSITDKYRQYQLALKAGMDVPATYFPKDFEEVNQIKGKLKYPALIKAENVNRWRNVISQNIKGFVVNNPDKLVEKFNFIFKNNIRAIVQEVIPGPDTNHFKFCSYISQDGDFLLQFTLRKIRQNPIRFGIGSMVESFEYQDLITLGKKFFQNINYRGIGSVEFKLDKRDAKFKFIELNPRYWQQNALAEKCGMNFPLIDYLEVTQQNPQPKFNFQANIKWINLYLDFCSFLEYKQEGNINIKEWISSLRGKKIFSRFALDDPLPSFYKMNLLKIPSKLINVLRYF